MVSIGPYTQAYDMKQMYDFPRVSKQPCYNKDSITDVVNTHSDFTIFSSIIKKAKYDTILSDKQANFTLFVPSDIELRKRYSKQDIDNIDIGTARQILAYSLMNRIIDKNLLISSPSMILPTIDRSHSLKISTVNNVTIIGENCSEIIHFNQQATNGIIHVINNLLVP